MEVNDMLNTLTRFKKYLEEDSMERRNRIEKYLINNCEDLNENRLNIWADGSVMLQNIRFFLRSHNHNMFWFFILKVISILKVAFESIFSINGHIFNQF